MVMIVVFPEIQVRLHMVMISKLPGCFFVGRVEEVEQLAQRYPDDREAEIFYALSLLASADPLDKTYKNQLNALSLRSTLQAMRASLLANAPVRAAVLV